MKPYGVSGLELESIDEAFALSDILLAGQDMVPEETGLRAVLEPTATFVRGRAETHILTHGDESDEPFSVIFADSIGAGLVKELVDLAAESHPDPAIQQAAAGMRDSYAAAVFDAAMGDAPPEAEPPQYRY